MLASSLNVIDGIIFCLPTFVLLFSFVVSISRACEGHSFTLYSIFSRLNDSSSLYDYIIAGAGCAGVIYHVIKRMLLFRKDEMKKVLVSLQAFHVSHFIYSLVASYIRIDNLY